MLYSTVHTVISREIDECWEKRTRNIVLPSKSKVFGRCSRVQWDYSWFGCPIVLRNTASEKLEWNSRHVYPSVLPSSRELSWFFSPCCTSLQSIAARSKYRRGIYSTSALVKLGITNSSPILPFQRFLLFWLIASHTQTSDVYTHISSCDKKWNLVS